MPSDAEGRPADEASHSPESVAGPRSASRPEGIQYGDSIHQYGDALVTIYTVGTGIGFGIIGNAAYDALKATAKKLVPRSRSGTSRAVAARELLARLAVQTRCAELDLPVPDIDDRCRVDWVSDKSGYIYYLWYHDHDLKAKVVIPKGKLDGCKLEVTIYMSRETVLREMMEEIRKLRGHISAADRQVIDESLSTIGAGDVEKQSLRRALGNIAGVAVMVGQVQVAAPVIEAIRKVTAAFDL